MRAQLSQQRVLALALGLVTAVPIVVAAGYALTGDWVPLGDNAHIAIRAYDVFTDRTPLVGQRSSGASGVISETAYSPGPLLFWLLALPVRLPDPAFLPLTVAAVNVASIAGTVALALRRGGVALMAATALAIPVMLMSLPAETYADVWNSSAPLMPVMLLVFLAWSVACGEYRLLPLMALVASFAIQSHLTFVAPAVGLSVVGLAGAIASKPRPPRRWVLATLAVVVVCWSAPLVDQAIHRPGNIVVLVRTAFSDEPSVGFDAGWRAVVHTVGVPPWWLQDPRDSLERIGDLTVRPGAFAIATTLLVLAGLAVAVVVGWRRRRTDLCAAGAVGLVLCASAGIAASATPVDSFATVGYTLRWTSPVGMCVWLLLGWAVASLARPRLRAVARPRRIAPVAGVATLAVAAVVAGAVAVRQNPPRSGPYQAMSAIGDRLDAAIPDEGATRVTVATSPTGLGLTNQLEVGTVFWLRRSGRGVVTSEELADRLDPDYARGPYDRVLELALDVPPTIPGRSVARQPVVESLDGSMHLARVTLDARRGR